jgi:hypothetical protein
MMGIGWKWKTIVLRSTMLSRAHQDAGALTPMLAKSIAVYHRQAEQGGVASENVEAVAELARIVEEHDRDPKPTWGRATIYGWTIGATMYRMDGQLWWLLHATHGSGDNMTSPNDKDVAMLHKILNELGAEPMRDMIIGPESKATARSADGEEVPLPIGWWTWINRFKLQSTKK